MRIPLLISALFLIAVACEKTDDSNPFDDPSLQPPEIKEENVRIPLDNFAGLHQNIFKPTCANSGCHDGTFEPDFRTIQSAYNTLVFQDIVKNDSLNPLSYRVDPGNAEKSMIILRMTKDIDGRSGIMPLEVDPGSEFLTRETEFINAIKTWINSGAKDALGNDPSLGNPLPQSLGAVAFNASGNKLNRIQNGPIQVPAGTGTIDLWIALADDAIAPNLLTYNKIKFSKERALFDTSPEETLSIVSPRSENGLLGDPVNYFHKISITPSNYGSSGEIIYFRVYVQDNSNTIAELPSDGGALYITKYMAFEIL